MSKPALLMAAAILTLSGAIVAMKSLIPATPATAMPHAVSAPARVATPTARLEMMAIVPAPVIDATAAVFVGTGDASGGGWVKP